MEERDGRFYKKGTRFSEEHKRKISESRKKYIAKHPEYRSIVGERTKKLIAEGKIGFSKGNTLRKGVKPWNYGLKASNDERVAKHTNILRPDGHPVNYKGGNYICLGCGKELANRHPKNKLCVKCFGESISGENHYNWKGGITEPNQAFRNSQAYKNWRKAVFEKDNYTCVWCGVRGYKLNADHIKSFSEYPELRVEISNGRTLCIDCHKKTPNYARNIR